MNQDAAILEHVELQALNTFGIKASGRWYYKAVDLTSLRNFLSSGVHRGRQVLILGGGSNLLFTRNFEGLIIHNCLPGLTIEALDSDYSLLRAGAGENWHQLVLYALGKGLYGAENLSLIPGSTGAAPIQNIGAYGVELKDIFHSLKGIHLETLQEQEFDSDACRFGYRDSIFKHALKNKFIITEVTLRLSHQQHPRTHYGDIQRVLDEQQLPATAINVSKAVIQIRQSKLPDPAELGNAGSFFKNPVIPSARYELLRQGNPDMPGYPDAGGMKVPAGWLIEKSGLKGLRRGSCGVHTRQALVLVNYGQASGSEVYALSEEIIATVQQRYGITLEREVNVI